MGDSKSEMDFALAAPALGLVGGFSFSEEAAVEQCLQLLLRTSVVGDAVRQGECAAALVLGGVRKQDQLQVVELVVMVASFEMKQHRCVRTTQSTDHAVCRGGSRSLPAAIQ